MINFENLVKNISNISKNYAKIINISKFPQDLIETFSVDSSLADYYKVLDLLKNIVIKIQWMPQIMFYVLCLEMEKAYASAEAPTEGLTIDVDHISALYMCDIFMTYDDKLCSSLKTWFKKYSEYNLPPRYILSRQSELDKIIKKKS